MMWLLSASVNVIAANSQIKYFEREDTIEKIVVISPQIDNAGMRQYRKQTLDKIGMTLFPFRLFPPDDFPTVDDVAAQYQRFARMLFQKKVGFFGFRPLRTEMYVRHNDGLVLLIFHSFCFALQKNDMYISKEIQSYDNFITTFALYRFPFLFPDKRCPSQAGEYFV